ncbi:hypothetical protein [Rhodococcus sp. I2R]|uniref:hypothetical protein n=1 Tax=Rhodococcus sp. I2R TaxID=2855445 RepID=UPI001E2A05FE|nr:hypothetical protein [Rhodococcus sp. I2R]MCC8927544.1 hypothetical protein [Rhodococcus sp. I2R]
MAVHRTEPLPEAPYSLDLLADLHAGVLSESVSERLWPLVRLDDAAMTVIAALDEVSTHLRELGDDHTVGEPIPPQVAEKIDRALEDATVATTAPAEAPTAVTTVTTLSSRRRPRAAIAVGLAATVVLAIAVTTAILMPSSGENSSETIADGLVVDPDSTLVVDSSEIDASFAYRIMADRDTIPLLGSEALADCLAANGFGASSTVLGAAPVELDGRQAVVLVVPQNSATPGLTLLAVGPDCGIDNPATLLRRDLD